MATSGWVYWDYNYYYPRSWGGMYKNAFITYDNNLYYLGSDSKWQSAGSRLAEIHTISEAGAA